MFYYPKLNSIFISNPKTGTHSVLNALSPYRGRERDIILPASLPTYIGAEHIEHLTAQQVLDLVGAAAWNRLFTFCVVRNPWDRLLSIYAYRRSSKPRYSQNWTFEQVVRWACDPNDRSFRPWQRSKQSQCWSIIGKNGRCLVDRVLRTEELTKAFPEMAKTHWGISLSIGVKGSSKHDTRNTMYTAELRALVGASFRRDIELFGYSFGTNHDRSPLDISKGDLLV